MMIINARMVKDLTPNQGPKLCIKALEIIKGLRPDIGAQIDRVVPVITAIDETIVSYKQKKLTPIESV